MGIDRLSNSKHRSEKKQSESDKSILVKIADIIGSFSGFMLVAYIIIFVLWVVVNWRGWGSVLIYTPAHFLFGNFKYLDFYLMHGIPTICLYTAPLFLMTMLICWKIADTKPSNKNLKTDSNANDSNEQDAIAKVTCTQCDRKYEMDYPKCPHCAETSKRKGFVETYRDVKYVIFLLLLPVIICVVVYFSWKYVLPDFEFVFKGDYLTVEVNSNDLSVTEITHRGRRGRRDYQYIVSIPSHLIPESDITQDKNPYFDNSQGRYSINGFTLNTSLPLYNRLNELRGRSPNRSPSVSDGPVSMGRRAAERTEREDVVIQIYYLPNTRLLLGYTIVE